MIGIVAFLAALQGTAYTESFARGQSVDLNQGFYVCDQPKPMERVALLARMHYPHMRRRLAARMGCPFQQKPLRSPARVLEVRGAVCGSRVPVQGGVMCQREAHQLIVRHGNQTRAAIFVLDDYDIE